MLRRPRSLALPQVALVARFDPQTAERITGMAERLRPAMAALGSAEDRQPGGRDYLAAIAATLRAVRDALVTGRDPDEDAEVEQLATFLRDQPATRLARAVVEVVKADVALEGLLADVAADSQLRERVDAAVEEWVGETCRLVDSDAPAPSSKPSKPTRPSGGRWRGCRCGWPTRGSATGCAAATTPTPGLPKRWPCTRCATGDRA